MALGARFRGGRVNYTSGPRKRLYGLKKGLRIDSGEFWVDFGGRDEGEAVFSLFFALQKRVGASRFFRALYGMGKGGTQWGVGGQKKGAPTEKKGAGPLRGKTKSQASFSHFAAFPLNRIVLMIRLLVIHN